MSTERTSAIEDTASRWLIQRDSGRWSGADQAQFDHWLNTSALHRVAYLRLEHAWEEAARLKALGAGIRGDAAPPPGQWNLTPFFDPEASGSGVQRGLHSHRGWCMAAAALVIAVAITGFLQIVLRGGSHSTGVGAVALVSMTDGSKVTLNTDSQIRIALTDTERAVDLKQGEAFFDVAKDPTRPFVVRVGNKRVIAVGTQFSVRREGDKMQVVVTEGKVRVEDAGDTLLSAGSIARADEAGVLVQRKTLSEAEQELTWRVGVLTFRDATLGVAVTEFNRYNTRKIVIRDPAVAALHIEGNFRATNAEAFVRLLESGFPVRATAESDKIILSSK